MAVDMRNGDVMKYFRYLVTGACTGVIVVLLVPVAVCGILSLIHILFYPFGDVVLPVNLAQSLVEPLQNLIICVAEIHGVMGV